MKNMDDEDELIDVGAEYSRKSGYDKSDVVKQQVLRCNELRSKEMREGHTLRVMDNKGNLKIIDVPDNRQPYVGSVTALKQNLLPEITNNKKYIDLVKKNEEKEKELFEQYKYKEMELKLINRKKILVYTGREFIPKKGAVLVVGTIRTATTPIKENKVEGIWDNKVNAYWDERVLISDELFGILNLLIDSVEYFKEVETW